MESRSGWIGPALQANLVFRSLHVFHHLNNELKNEYDVIKSWLWRNGNTFDIVYVNKNVVMSQNMLQNKYVNSPKIKV